MSGFINAGVVHASFQHFCSSIPVFGNAGRYVCEWFNWGNWGLDKVYVVYNARRLGLLVVL